MWYFFRRHTCWRSEHGKLSLQWIGQTFHSQFNCKTRATASIYASNWDDCSVFISVFSLIPNLDSHTLILGGDLNCVIDLVLDRSSSRIILPSKMSQTLSTFMDQFGYMDPWRFSNPSSRQYSFFSHAHWSFSHIDYFLVDKKLITSLISVQYLPITVSDHSAIVLDLHFDLKPKHIWFWRLDPLTWRRKILFLIIFLTPSQSFVTPTKIKRPPHHCYGISWRLFLEARYFHMHPMLITQNV